MYLMVTRNLIKMVSNHYKKQRYKREKFIDKHLNGDGEVIDSFIINNGHPDGVERHDITENGIILIYNMTTQKLITKLIAREWQIKRYYKNEGREPPPEYENVLQLARWHESLHYNHM